MEDKIRIKVVGLGGFGLSTVELMSKGIVGVDFLGLSNKHPIINDSNLTEKILLGGGVTTNHSPELGKKRVLDSKEEITKSLEGYDVIIIVTALGFGTGTGGAPLVAKMGLFQLKAICDSILVFSNQKLIKGTAKPTDGVEEKLLSVKNQIRYMVSSLVNMLNYSKGISMNAFDSLRSLFRSNKEMFFGCGAVMGEFQAVSALRHAIKSDLLITSLSNANRILLTIDYKEEISKETLDLLYDEIYNITGDDVDIIYTSSINPESMGILFVSVFATGEDIKDNNKSISDFDKLKDAINPNNFL